MFKEHRAVGYEKFVSLNNSVGDFFGEYLLFKKTLGYDVRHDLGINYILFILSLQDLCDLFCLPQFKVNGLEVQVVLCILGHTCKVI